MPTSPSEWASLLIIGITTGVVSGAFTRRVATLLVRAAVLQIIAAPIIYYTPPILSHSALAEYHAWSLIIVPMIAVQSFILAVISGLLLFFLRRAV
jgi:hypothetical protein